jgi:hypothetical protein
MAVDRAPLLDRRFLDALDALAAHCITLLNVALTSITDAAEARAIGKLLG